MSEFVQIHLLTSYPPANLNRDDLGRPKTAVMGGCQRLRVSSQSLKRAWRTSDVFREWVQGRVGTRTKEMGRRIHDQLLEGGMEAKPAQEAARAIAARFGKLKKEGFDIEQLAHFGPEEIEAIEVLVRKLCEEKRQPTENELDLLRFRQRAADIALFGRMLADSPAYNVDAAAQVAHAISVSEVAVEDDYFTAVDDLNAGTEDRGAAHLGETGFAAGLLYLYICLNRTLLLDNLDGDEELAGRTVKGLLDSAARISPGGKQNSFASRSYASWVLVEKGRRQPRSLSVAFLAPVRDRDLLTGAIERISTVRERMDQTYGPIAEGTMAVNAHAGEGSFEELLSFAAVPLPVEETA